MPTEELKQEILLKLSLPVKIDNKNAQLKEYEIPRDIEFVSELPRKAGTEKIDYSLLEDMELNKLKNNQKKLVK